MQVYVMVVYVGVCGGSVCSGAFGGSTVHRADLQCIQILCNLNNMYIHTMLHV